MVIRARTALLFVALVAWKAPSVAFAQDIFEVRPVGNWLEAQVELHRRGFSCGPIDGVPGAQTAAALKEFQLSAGLSPTGSLNRETSEALLLTEPAIAEHTLSTEEFASIQPAATTWLEKSQRERMGFNSVLELVAERYRAGHAYLRRLNPTAVWEQLLPGAVIKVPAANIFLGPRPAAEIRVNLTQRHLRVLDSQGSLVAYFPVSIAKAVEKRPVGQLKVTIIIPDPNYTFDPAVFTESEEARTLGRRLIIAPGPNNPVGVAWIGLDRSGYGIHGTPEPEKVGRTESHGCFRLANWDARSLLAIVEVGMPVHVEP